MTESLWYLSLQTTSITLLSLCLALKASAWLLSVDGSAPTPDILDGFFCAAPFILKGFLLFGMITGAVAMQLSTWCPVLVKNVTHSYALIQRLQLAVWLEKGSQRREMETVFELKDSLSQHSSHSVSSAPVGTCPLTKHCTWQLAAQPNPYLQKVIMY